MGNNKTVPPPPALQATSRRKHREGMRCASLEIPGPRSDIQRASCC